MTPTREVEIAAKKEAVSEIKIRLLVMFKPKLPAFSSPNKRRLLGRMAARAAARPARE